jgi:ketosteroid isomerase-like protein
MDSDEEQIRHVIEAWHRHTAKGELDEVLAMMTENATFLRCGHPPRERLAISDQGFGIRQTAGLLRSTPSWISMPVKS